MTQRDDEDASNQAVVVCEHVFEQREPARYAAKDEPAVDADGGWQLLCWTVGEEDVTTAKLLSPGEAFRLVPELREILDARGGSQWFRERGDARFREISGGQLPPIVPASA